MIPSKAGFPCRPRGSVLLISNDLELWIPPLRGILTPQYEENLKVAYLFRGQRVYAKSEDELAIGGNAKRVL